MQVFAVKAAAIIPGSFLALKCCRGENPMREFLRERITCTWFVAIGSVGSAKTLKEVQSLKKDKSWNYPGRLDREYLKAIIKWHRGSVQAIGMLPVILIRLYKA